MKSKRKKLRKYLYEYLSIFFAVISAFTLNTCNENKGQRQSENKILTEISNSIENDIKDFEVNIGGNQLSLRADEIFRALIKNEKTNQDSIGLMYMALFRDYIPIINKSAYESFKSNNLKTILNDSLRLQIIELYDYHYSIIEALEYEVAEMKSFDNYFSEINTLLYPYMSFDETTGDLIAINGPINLEADEKKKILSYLWRIRKNRQFKLLKYKSIIKAIDKVKTTIQQEI